MTRFSDKCKELIDLNGTTIYRLSKDHSLELTTLQRMATGKRLPNQEFFNRFCNCLSINDTEKKELSELYKIELLGENTYLCRQCILELFSQLSHKKFSESVQKDSFSSNNLFFDTLVETSYLPDNHIIFSIINEIFESNHESCIYSNLPPIQQIYSQLQKLSKTNKKIQFLHLLHFQIDNSHSLSNLQSFTQIIQFISSSSLAYYPYYFYTHMPSMEKYSLLFPYYFITKDKIIYFSSNLNKYIYITEKKVIESHIQAFTKIIRQSCALIHRLDTHYQPVFQNSNYNDSYDFYFSFSPLSFIKNQVNENHMKDNSIYFFSKTFFDQLFDLEKNDVLQATINKLKLILEHPIIDHCYMLDNNIPIPSEQIIHIEKNPIITVWKNPSSEKQGFFIQESSIYNAFYDFAQSLISESIAYDPNKTKKMLQDTIEQLK